MFSLWRGTTNAGRGRLVRALGEELRVGGRFRRGRAGFGGGGRSVFRLSRLEEGPDGGLGRFRRHGRGGRERLRHSGLGGTFCSLCLGTALDRAGWLQRFFGRAGVWFFGSVRRPSVFWVESTRFRARCVVKEDAKKGGHEKRELDGGTPRS